MKCSTFKNIVNKYKYRHINLLHIDAEGYDYEIIKTICFDKIKIDFIIFEHKHLKKKDYVECCNKLNSIGYYIIAIEGDTICIKKQYYKAVNFAEKIHKKHNYSVVFHVDK